MKCEDCIHERVCKNAYLFKVTPPNVCGFFKNKADYAEVKQGYWINHYSDLYPADCTQECSIGHAEEGGNLWNDNYCPNCGPRMDGRSKK